MKKQEVEAAVGMTRKWDAREAGREVAKSTLKKLKSPPHFFVLISTIHYKKNGGFQKLLDGVYEVLPKHIPLIGGTATGFMNNYGVFSRGVSALAVSSQYMDVSIGYGKNTKRNPKNAARQSINMVKKGLKDSNYEKKFLLNLISSAEIPNIPPIGRKKIIREGLAIKMVMQLFGFSQYVLQKGAGRDDEVMEEMTKLLPDYSMLGGGTLDNGIGFTNFQFYNNKVLKNSVVTLGIRTENNLDVLTTHNMKKTDIDFQITKTSKDGSIIHEINGKPAASELIRLLDWPEDIVRDETWFNTNYYFPLGFHIHDFDEKLGPRVIVGIYGESLITTIRSKDPNASILTIDGRSLLETIDNNLKSYHKNPSFGLIASCAIRMVTLGKEIYKARDLMMDYFGDHPFLVFYVGGESTYSPEKSLTYANMSFNTAIFWN